MIKSSANGICTYCQMEVSKNSQSILSHLANCQDKHSSEGSDREDFVLLLIEDKYSPEYWLVIKAKPTIPLKWIDKFIRDIWVECCGHLSEFSDKYSKISMAQSLDQVFSEGNKIEYVYDFGTSTELKLSLIQSIQDVDDKDITILFRNKEPEFKCSLCAKKAIALCPFCIDEGDGFLCQSCMDKHKCIQDEGEDLALPLVNSPRAGVCGYSGSADKKIKKYFPKNVI